MVKSHEMDVKEVIDLTDLLRNALIRLSWYPEGHTHHNATKKQVNEYAQRVYDKIHEKHTVQVLVKDSA